jgi:hypothetical protein
MFFETFCDDFLTHKRFIGSSFFSSNMRIITSLITLSASFTHLGCNSDKDKKTKSVTPAVTKTGKSGHSTTATKVAASSKPASTASAPDPVRSKKSADDETAVDGADASTGDKVVATAAKPVAKSASEPEVANHVAGREDITEADRD